MKIEKDSLYVIALDGPAGSGKSSVASVLSDKLGCIHADSGAMYRTLTLACIQKIGALSNHTEFGTSLEKALDSQSIVASELKCSTSLNQNNKQCNLIDNTDVGDAIRTGEVTHRIRYIANNRTFRDQVNQMLHQLASKTSLVVDGRDIGSVVFPDTPWKFYLDASTSVRANRRYLEYQEKGMELDTTEKELELQIAKRDSEDQNRPFGGLCQATDAILIDTSSMSRNAVIEHLLARLQIKF